MKKNLILLLACGIMVCSSAIRAEGGAGANTPQKSEISYSPEDWEIKNIPASNNKDKTIYIFTEQAQVLTFVIKTAPANIRKKSKIKLEFLFPAGTEFYGAKTLKVQKYNCSRTDLADRNEITVEFESDESILQDKKERENEWKNFQAVIKLPEGCLKQWELPVKMFVDNHYINTYAWPVNSEKITGRGSKLNSIRLGLWDYGVSSCDFAASEIIEFYKATGINYNQASIGKDKLAKPSVLFGGGTNHALFYNKDYPDIDCQGKVCEATFCDPQAVINNGAQVVDNGIRILIENAKNGNGTATVDYEPTGDGGFSKISIAAFLNCNKLSMEQFEKFRKEYAKSKFLMYKAKDPAILDIFNKWIAFRSWQTQEYIGIIAKELKKRDPDVKFELTCRLSIGNDDIATRALGNNNGTMTKYLDAIMPQIYCGYDNASTKEAALQTGKWKHEIQYLNPACKLYPILLVRYGGVSVFNSPDRIRQQTIGAIAEGADGVVYYYTQQMDARYWAFVMPPPK